MENGIAPNANPNTMPINMTTRLGSFRLFTAFPKETWLIETKKPLWNQYQPCVPFGCATTCHSGTDSPAGDHQQAVAFLQYLVGGRNTDMTVTPQTGNHKFRITHLSYILDTPALGCAVAYPMGVIGVILAVLLIRKFLVHKEDLEIKEKDDANEY